jgi:hypothetical protein
MTAAFEFDQGISRNQNLVLRPEGDEALLFNPDTGSVKVLNPTGVYLWQQLDGERTYIELVDLLCRHYADPPRQQIKSDVKAFLKRLMKKNAISAG